MLINNKNNPCRNCEPPKRKVGCHSYCPEYLEHLEKFHAIQDKIRNEQINEGNFKAYIKTNWKRSQK